MLHKTGGGKNEGAHSSANVGVQDGIILKPYRRQVEWGQVKIYKIYAAFFFLSTFLPVLTPGKSKMAAVCKIAKQTF